VQTHHAGACQPDSQAKRVSKWFYDTSPGTVTRAVYRGLLIGEAKALHVQARWTQWFTWFGPSERSTLRP
jgi:hypothetical protein